MLSSGNQTDKERSDEHKPEEAKSGSSEQQASRHTSRDAKHQAQDGRSKSSNDKSHEHDEGRVAKMIEQQTAKLPSDIFLWAAGASILGSLSLQAQGNKLGALFVGQWVSPFLILGLYNKLVKVAGSDQTENQIHK